MTAPTTQRFDSNSQYRASNPEVSAWVAANAGSGKTHLLVNRAIRLLLNGTPPERILCLTFTVAAATEMAKRLFETLGEWVALDDPSLSRQIRNLVGRNIDASVGLDSARRLFARVLDAPGGLKVQTLHAFCERLLQRFPLEAGVIPGFRVLDEQEANEILSECRRAVLSGTGEGSSPTLQDSLDSIIAYAGEEHFDQLFAELLKSRKILYELPTRGRLRMYLAAVMGLTTDLTVDQIASHEVMSLNRGLYSKLASHLETNGKNAMMKSQQIRRALEASTAHSCLEHLRNLYLTKEGDPRSHKFLVPKAFRLNFAELADFLVAEQARLIPVFHQYDSVRVVDASLALLEIGAEVIHRYEQEKNIRGVCDYDDLIIKTLKMFLAGDYGGWILYKLDGGIDHILIDEAQDTSSNQWQIIQQLTGEFFAGRGARPEITRTIFAVGDEKQSIFGFQGASPQSFAEMCQVFRALCKAAGFGFEEVPLNVSFRSTKAILDIVDAVFAGQLHHAVRQTEVGRVELWPLEEDENVEKHDPWSAPLDYQLPDRPRRKLAVRIARTIRSWITLGEILPGVGRPIQPDDILILVRQRTTLMDELVRALKSEGLPVAGADRLELTSHIAIMDLIALGKALLLPEDDQMFACVLKSPLLERDDGKPIDDQDLFELAYSRGDAALWQRFDDACSKGRPYTRARQLLTTWRKNVTIKSPFEFYTEVLNSENVYTRVLSRLGTEADEPISAFLSQCLDYDTSRPASLESFLQWLTFSQTEIKRDMDFGAGEIRVMTVHGAKGLESNIVILPDTCSPPDSTKDPKILPLQGSLGNETFNVLLWRISQSKKNSVFANLLDVHRNTEMDEYARLLYVAMTRARDRLYVCGHTGRERKGELNPLCWYSRIEAALLERGRSIVDSEGRMILYYEGSQKEPAVECIAHPSRDPEKSIALPAWILEAAPSENAPQDYLRPSGGVTALRRERITPPLFTSEIPRFQRGSLIHRLLEIIPSVSRSKQREVAIRFLAQPGHRLSIEQQTEIYSSVMKLLEDPVFGPLFAEKGLAEVPFCTSPLAENRPALSGRIDRLIVTDHEVLIVDFKTNRLPPALIEQADPSYIWQIAIYAQAMKGVFPSKTIRAAILWTEIPSLMEVPERMFDMPLTRSSDGPAADLLLPAIASPGRA